MAGDRLVKVKILADGSQAQQAMGELGSRAQQVGQSLESVGNSLTVGVSLPLAAAGAAAFTWGVGTEEATNKVNVVFGEAADGIIAFADTAAESMGMSSLAALDAAGTIGNLFRAMEIGEEPAAAMSQQIITLAGDLASFNNADPTQVMQALQSGLVGQVEPLRQFGVNLTQARIEQEALTLGLWDGTGALDAGAKAQAAFSIIMQDTSLAQGDFARTADGAANQIRTMWAEVQDLGAELGTVLIPIVQQVVGAISGLVQWFGDLSPAVQTTVVYMAALVAAIGPLMSITGRMIQFGTELGKMFKLMGLSAMEGSLALGVVGVVIGGLILQHQQFKQSIAELRGEITGLDADAAQLAITHELIERGITDAAAAAALSAVAYGTATQAQRDLVAQIPFSEQLIDHLRTAIEEEATSTAAMELATRNAGKGFADMAEDAATAHQGVQDVTAAVERMPGPYSIGEGATRSLASAQADVHAKFDAATAAMNNQQDTLRAMTDPVFAAIQASQNLSAAQVTLTELQNGGAASAAELAAAELDVVAAHIEVRDANAQLAASPGAAAAFNSARDAAFSARGAVGQLRGSLDEVEAQLERMNGRIYKFTVDGSVTAAGKTAAATGSFLDGRIGGP